MRTTPRHARSDVPQPRRNQHPTDPPQPAAITPLGRAARAAYTRPDTSVPFEQRPLARQSYWIRAVRRALEAALDLGELAGVISAHSQHYYDAGIGLYRCAACSKVLTGTWADHIAAAIRAHFLGHDRQTSAGGGDDSSSTSAQVTLSSGASDGSTRP